MLWQSPLSTATDLTAQTYRSWRSEPDDTARSYVWLREHTPKGTVVIAPPWRADFWFLSHRAQVVSVNFPTYIDLGEWRRRVELLGGEPMANRNNKETDERPAFYHALTEDKINDLARQFNASYVVSESDYSFLITFSSGKNKVYRLPTP